MINEKTKTDPTGFSAVQLHLWFTKLPILSRRSRTDETVSGFCIVSQILSSASAETGYEGCIQ